MDVGGAVVIPRIRTRATSSLEYAELLGILHDVRLIDDSHGHEIALGCIVLLAARTPKQVDREVLLAARDARSLAKYGDTRSTMIALRLVRALVQGDDVSELSARVDYARAALEEVAS